MSGHESVTILPSALTASPITPHSSHGVRSWRIGTSPRRKVDQKASSAHLWLQDLFAGTTCSVLSVAYCLSFATLIFSGPLSGLLGYGIAIGLLSASIGALVIGIRSTLPIVIAGPDSPTSAVLAVLVANFVHRLVAEGASDDVLRPAIVLMTLVTALTGAVLLVLGLTRAGRAIRFVPYPVIGGCLGATGWLIAAGGVQVAARGACHHRQRELTAEFLDQRQAAGGPDSRGRAAARSALAAKLFGGASRAGEWCGGSASRAAVVRDSIGRGAGKRLDVRPTIECGARATLARR